MSDEQKPTLQINGQDQWGPYIGRISYNDVGRMVLEIIEDDDTVLVKEGDEFCSLFAGMPLGKKVE